MRAALYCGDWEDHRRHALQVLYNDDDDDTTTTTAGENATTDDNTMEDVVGNAMENVAKDYAMGVDLLDDRIYALGCVHVPTEVDLHDQLLRINTATPQVLTTGSPIDGLYGHCRRGPLVASLTELCGLRHTGKTHYCLQLARSLLAQDAECGILWIDCRCPGAFGRQRVITETQFLERIYTRRAFGAADCFLALNEAIGRLVNIRLIVLEDVHVAFMNSPEQSRLLKRLARKLRWLMACLPAWVLSVQGVYDSSFHGHSHSHGYSSSSSLSLDRWMQPILTDGWTFAVDQRVTLFPHFCDTAKRKVIKAVLTKCVDKDNECRPYGQSVVVYDPIITVPSQSD